MPTPKQDALQKCPTCERVGDDVGKCGSFVTCGARNGTVPVGPQDVVIHCDPCDVTRAISATKLIDGKALKDRFPCPNPSACQCKPVLSGMLQAAAADQAPSPAFVPDQALALTTLEQAKILAAEGSVIADMKASGLLPKDEPAQAPATKAKAKATRGNEG